MNFPKKCKTCDEYMIAIIGGHQCINDNCEKPINTTEKQEGE